MAVNMWHRFGMDGAEEQREVLKSKLKRMRKTKDPKRKGGGDFKNKMLL